MNSIEFTVSADVLTRLFSFLLYAPVCLFVYWKLIPRLSPTAKHLASGFLAVQVLVIVISLEIRPSSSFEGWLWHLDREWNIPSTLASVQLAMVGSVALVAAWLAKVRSAWQRFYLLGLGLLFLFLGRDEYANLHELIPNWLNWYAALGTAVVVITLAVALCSPRRTRIWHLCLLAGLAVSASGALVIERGPPEICGILVFLRLDECLWAYNFEEPLEFLGIWLALVAVLGHFSNTAPMSKHRVLRFLYALPAFWILLLSQSEAILPTVPFVADAQPAAVEFESDIHLHGFRIERKNSYRLHLHLYLSPRQWDFKGLGYSIHPVDQISGDSIARHDQYANRQLEFLLGPGYIPIYRQWVEVQIPPQTPVNRAFWLVLTLWREQDGEYVRQKILASDHQLLGETQVALDEMVIPAVSTATPTDPTALFDNGFALDAADMPERARHGETLNIRFDWRNDVDEREDYVQFLHLVHQESGILWNHDQPPLGPRLPTRLWYNGLADSETWQVALPADLAPGQYIVFTGLYRQSDLERIPASDIDGKPFLDARVPLGSLMIE